MIAGRVFRHALCSAAVSQCCGGSLPLFLGRTDRLFSTEKQRNRKLEKRRSTPVLLESDIEEQFARGAGPGGQKINTRSNKVQLTHTPTGITVDCQEFRDLTSNRKRARSILRDKVDFHLHGAKSKLGMRHDKVRKKKSKSAQKARKKYGNVPKTPDVSADACEDESNDNSDGLEEELYDYNESDDDDESDYDGENDSHSPNVTSTVDNKT